MAGEMNKQLTPEIRAQIEAKHMTIFEFITLASLVEKEALFDEDRPIIAAVFLKRLQIGMPLQSCASIQYILGYPKPHISIEDTKLPSPYNTYMHVLTAGTDCQSGHEIHGSGTQCAKYGLSLLCSG